MYRSLHKKNIPKKDLYKKKIPKYLNHDYVSINFLNNLKTENNIQLKPTIKTFSRFDNQIRLSKNIISSKLFRNKVYLISTSAFLLLFYIIFNSPFNKVNSELKPLSIQNNEKINEIISSPTTLIKNNKINNTIITTSTTTTTINNDIDEEFVSFKINNLKDAQTQLKRLYIYQGKIDGLNGKFTKLSIREFQKRSGLAIDGILGPNTKAALAKGEESYENSVDQELKLISEYEVTEETKDLQNKLFKLNIYTGDIDGVFGYQTIISLKEFQNKAGLLTDGVYGPKTKESLEKGEDAFVSIEVTNVKLSEPEPIEINQNTSLTVDLRNYNPNDNCIEGYVNENNIWVPDPCFIPVFVYRYGNVAQVNSQAELDAYLNQNWSLTKEKTYTSLGRVSTQNYIDGYNSPLNGLPMPSGSNNSIVIGIKNDNNVRARPQSGPQNADAVVEVLVEGGMTRFINIFYQSDTSYHGPIRSARPTDPTVLRPVGGVLVASGATGGLIPEIVDMGVPVITDRRPEYFRIASRNAPHNLYADTIKLKELAVSKGYKKYINPQPLFPWGEPSLNNWISNSYLTLTFSSYTSTTWNWNGSSYIRTYYDAYKNSFLDNPHYWIDNNGIQGQISTTTVIALFCEPYTHPLQLPSVKTVGNGRAIILHNGKLLDARWKRGSNLDPFHIVDKSDNILYVPKGKVWISLVPNTKNPSFG